MRFRATPWFCLSWILLLTGAGGQAQESVLTEYQIKAAFLFNFARFVQWPAATFAEAGSPIVIGIIGEDPFHDDLARTIRNKTVDDHPLVIKLFRSPAEATNCQILFISTSEKDRLLEILAALKGASVLTVGETDRFTDNGGMIKFLRAGTKLRFKINQDAATKAGLKISSKLLNLGTHTET